MDKFIFKKNKLQERLEREATEGLEIAICTFYNIENSIDLTEDQINHLEELSNSEEDGYIQMAYTNIINNWDHNQEN
tara:strand:+ start:1712 stop:1942 length:231 start_codon:yes stop_codon:yes gene_type:complete